MPLDSIADLERRIRRLEMELDQYKHKFVAPDRTVKTEPPLAHIDHGSLAGLGDDDHPQYRKVADSIDHGALTGLGDNDHPQYLLTTDKAADSDKLDGVDSTGFATATHNHTGTYLPIDGKAANSDKLDDVDITAFKGLDSLTDPNADRVLFWDDSAGALKWLMVDGIVDTDLGKWQSYTVSWTASTTNPSIGNGILNGRYVQIGKTVMGTIEMIVGSTTTYGSGGWYFSLPKAVASNAFLTGNWVVVDASPFKFYAGLLRAYGSESKITQFIRDAGVYWVDATTPHTWAIVTGKQIGRAHV